MQAEFQNLKISITDEVHLKAVCDVLESMGYKNRWLDFPIEDHRFASGFKSIACYQDGGYSVYTIPVYFLVFCKEATLTDLLKMRDKAFKEAIK